MDAIVSRCGFRCDLCPAFIANNKSSDDQLKAASGWSRYLGLKMSPERICCSGCLSEMKTECDLPDKACPIKPCVLKHEMNTCADCFDYPCEMLETRMKVVDEAILQFKGKIPQEEYDFFISPYDFRKILGEIRDKRIDRID